MRPQETPTPSPAPLPPAPTGVLVGGQATTISGAPIPITREEVAQIRARREELSDQLISATNRRDELAEQMIESEGAARVGIEQRIILLDERILQLEADIAETGRQLTSAGSDLTSSTAVRLDGPFGGLSADQVTGISIVFILFVLTPLVVTLAVRLFRRPVAPKAIPALDSIANRMERLENAIDAVAVEVERISEGQRFVTRLLGEGQRPAEPIRVGEGSAQRVPRGGA